MAHFDDSLLDDDAHLARHGDRLRQLALLGARLRDTDEEACRGVVARLIRPRAVIAVGAEARLLRAVVEPTCPVPFVAWPLAQLPSWVGPLDLVVVLGGRDAALGEATRQAVRRGSQLAVVAPAGSPLLEFVPAWARVPVTGHDQFVTATLGLLALAQLGLGPAVDIPALADAVDGVAEALGPRHPLGKNPAKELACALADTIPLVWGEPVLAARAARRVAEAIRGASHRPALSADAAELLPLIEGAGSVDVFADPVEDPGAERTYSMVLLADGSDAPAEERLAAAAESKAIRVERLAVDEGPVLTRYALLLQQGLYAAAYVALAMAQ